MLPFTSLSSVSATGPGTSKDLEGIYNSHTMQVTQATVPAGDNYLVSLQGSLDGTNWFSMGTFFGNPSGPTGAVGSGFATRYVRANVSQLTAGVSNITVLIGSTKTD